MKTDPAAALKEVSDTVIASLPPSERRLPEPSSKANNAIWIIITLAFAATMIYATWVLGRGVSIALVDGAEYATQSGTMLTVFTTVVGFLAGLLSPSPLSK